MFSFLFQILEVKGGFLRGWVSVLYWVFLTGSPF
jgi:hypothetical protein